MNQAPGTPNCVSFDYDTKLIAERSDAKPWLLHLDSRHGNQSVGSVASRGFPSFHRYLFGFGEQPGFDGDYD